jgi:hypothetical protein
VIFLHHQHDKRGFIHTGHRYNKPYWYYHLGRIYENGVKCPFCKTETLLLLDEKPPKKRTRLYFYCDKCDNDWEFDDMGVEE